MRTDSRIDTQPSWLATWCVLSAVLATLSVGCQRGMYDARSLPPELCAGPIVDTQSLDLSGLASSSANSQRINVGDTLNMRVITGAEEETPEEWPLRVDADGTVLVPLVGPIQLAGLDVQSAQKVVRNASIERGIYRQPSVSISLATRQTNRVTVIGAVPEPGEYELPLSNSNLLAAIAAAGSLTDDADRFVEIRQPPAREVPTNPGLALPHEMATSDAERDIQQVAFQQAQAATTGPDVMHIDLVSATEAPMAGGYPLRDGAVVMVRKRPPRFIHVIGLVERPDQFELPSNKNVRVLDAIAMAGGTTVSLADRLFVVRQIEGSSEPALIEVSIRDAKENSDANLALADGDVVSVEETPATFVLSTLQQFIRLGVNGSVRVF